MPHLNLTLSKERLEAPYTWCVIACGMAVCGISIYHAAVRGIDGQVLLLALLTVVVASRVHIKIPRFNGTITVADTFVFLTMLLCGGPAAVLVATAEAVTSSARVSRRVTTYLFNAGSAACSTWATVSALNLLFGDPSQLTAHLSTAMFVLAICVMALTQYGVNLTLVAIRQACKFDLPLWYEWSRYYLWTSVTYLVGAAAAGLVAWFFGALNLYAFLVITSIIALIYFTCRTYLRNLDAMQESEARFRSSFDHAAIGMALVSPDGRWLQVNDSLCRLLGHTSEQMLCGNYREVMHPDDLALSQTNINELLVGGSLARQMELRYIHRAGHEVWVLLSASTARDTHNAVRHLIFQVQDATLRKKAEAQLVYDASHDSLTGLPNRPAFTAQLKAALGRVEQQSGGGLLAVLFLDLDGFKTVNDSLGHGTGDELLKGIAGRLLKCVRPGDTVARLGGDEFTILLEGISNIQQAVEVAERVKEKLTLPFLLAGHEVFTGTSVGIASSLFGYTDPGDMLRDADAAMYQAKAQGKSCHAMFDEQMHEDATKRLCLESDLRRAVERNEFVVYYQPIRVLATNELRGFEALVRWLHPVQGLLSPAQFVPLAEENGLIVQIDNIVLAEACRQLREWQLQYADCGGLTINVNVSSKQFAHEGLVEVVKRVVKETGIDPRSLQLELTESAMMKNLQNTARVLNELSLLGISISIDDFGTGYSNLSYLHEFPISTLKIDRSFVNRLSGREEEWEIVRTILMLAHNLKMSVVAEGIETSEQLWQLRNLGCDYAQGYHISPPVKADDAAKMLPTGDGQFAFPSSVTARAGLRLVSAG